MATQPRRLLIASRHQMQAEHKRAEAQALLHKHPQISDSVWQLSEAGRAVLRQYNFLLLRVGFHTIQAELWRRAYRQWGE